MNFQGTGKWFELQDLHVTEILPQMITLSEAYIQVSPGYIFNVNVTFHLSIRGGLHFFCY